MRVRRLVRTFVKIAGPALSGKWKVQRGEMSEHGEWDLKLNQPGDGILSFWLNDLRQVGVNRDGVGQTFGKWTTVAQTP